MSTMQELVWQCHETAKQKGFWTGPQNDNVPTKIALLHSELSEMLEAFRSGSRPCDKDVEILEEGRWRRATNVEEEAADVLIRLFDLCGRLEIDLERVTLAKMRYNESREHMHGKNF